jgi:hypothetical protein
MALVLIIALVVVFLIVQKRRKIALALGTGTVMVFFGGVVPSAWAAQPTVGMGTAAPFAVLAGTTPSGESHRVPGVLSCWELFNPPKESPWRHVLRPRWVPMPMRSSDSSTLRNAPGSPTLSRLLRMTRSQLTPGSPRAWSGLDARTPMPNAAPWLGSRRSLTSLPGVHPWVSRPQTPMRTSLITCLGIASGPVRKPVLNWWAVRDSNPRPLACHESFSSNSMQSCGVPHQAQARTMGPD